MLLYFTIERPVRKGACGAKTRLTHELRLYDDHVQILRDGPRKFLRVAQDRCSGPLRMTAFVFEIREGRIKGKSGSRHAWKNVEITAQTCKNLNENETASTFPQTASIDSLGGWR